MSIPGVPPGVRRQVLQAFVAALKADPLLSNNRAIRTWLTWDGRTPVADPTIDMMPCIQVRLLSGPVRRLVGTRLRGGPKSYVIESRPTVQVELWTSGTDQGDLADVADLVYRALAPQDPDARAALDRRLGSVGIRDLHLVREILPPSAEAFSQEGIGGSGAYELTIQVNS